MSLPPGPRPTPIPGRNSTLIEPKTAAPSVANRSATLIESEMVPAPLDSPLPPVPEPTEARRAEPFRPIARPSTATLTVYDDGSDEGESIRLRGDRFLIGRTEGDLTLPHDNRVSSRHLEIVRRSVSGGFRWSLTDLQSTNGLFVRVRRAILVDGSEFLVGSGRYRFVTPAVAGVVPDLDSRGQTLGWQGEPSSERTPSLIELIGSDERNPFALMRPEYWIGTDSHCPIRRPEDPFCELKHARLQRSPTGEWTIEHNRTLNGLWLRMNHVEVEGLILFQIGEQRLRLKVQ